MHCDFKFNYVKHDIKAARLHSSAIHMKNSKYVLTNVHKLIGRTAKSNMVISMLDNNKIPENNSEFSGVIIFMCN